MSKTVQVGLIGFGIAGKVFLAPFIDAVEGFRLKKVSTSNEVAAADAKARYPQVTIVPSADEIINDPEIDLVVVGTPNTSHFSLAQQALLASKHVLVEKPFTITTKDADELIALANKQGKLLTVHQNRRWDSDFKTIKKLVDSQILGNMVEYEAHYDRFRPQLKAKAWREDPLPGSGILYDLGAHLIDQALHLFGLPQEVMADIQHQRPGGQTDDYFDVSLFYPTFKVILKGGMLVKDPGPHFKIMGDKGTFTKYGMDTQEENLKAGKGPLEMSDWGKEPETLWGTLDTEIKGLNFRGKVESETGNYLGLFENVYQAIIGEEPLTVTADHARNTIRVIELARQSHEEKKVVPFT